MTIHTQKVHASAVTPPVTPPPEENAIASQKDGKNASLAHTWNAVRGMIAPRRDGPCACIQLQKDREGTILAQDKATANFHLLCTQVVQKVELLESKRVSDFERHLEAFSAVIGTSK
jgi:hypothetical protein